MNTTEKIQTYLNDPKIVSVNTVDAHSDHKYFESLAEFSEGEMKLRQSLNGKWKIHYAQNTNQVLKDFYKTEFDETDLNFINVPGHLELQGFGSPQYVNTNILGMVKNSFVHLKFLKNQMLLHHTLNILP